MTDLFLKGDRVRLSETALRSGVSAGWDPIYYPKSRRTTDYGTVHTRPRPPYVTVLWDGLHSTHRYHESFLTRVQRMVPEDLYGEGYWRGPDPHRSTAAQVFEKPYALVTEEERGKGKALNYGPMYHNHPNPNWFSAVYATGHEMRMDNQPVDSAISRAKFKDIFKAPFTVMNGANILRQSAEADRMLAQVLEDLKCKVCQGAAPVTCTGCHGTGYDGGAEVYL